MNNPTTPRRSPLGMIPGQPTPRLYDRVVEVLRSFIYGIRRFILFHAGVAHASACHVLEQPLTRAEVEAVLAQLDGVPGPVSTLLYASGLIRCQRIGATPRKAGNTACPWSLYILSGCRGGGEALIAGVEGQLGHQFGGLGHLLAK